MEWVLYLMLISTNITRSKLTELTHCHNVHIGTSMVTTGNWPCENHGLYQIWYGHHGSQINHTYFRLLRVWVDCMPPVNLLHLFWAQYWAIFLNIGCIGKVKIRGITYLTVCGGTFNINYCTRISINYTIQNTWNYSEWWESAIIWAIAGNPGIEEFEPMIQQPFLPERYQSSCYAAYNLLDDNQLRMHVQHPLKMLYKLLELDM